MKRALLVVVVLLVLGGGLWLLRGAAAPGGPVDLVPGDARIYGQLASLPGPVARVRATVRQLGFGSLLSARLEGVTRQVGFDPFDPQALGENGIDPTRPVAGFQPADGEGLVLLLPLTKVPLFAATFTRLWSDRTGGPVKEVVLEGHQAWTAYDSEGVLGSAWAPVAGYAVIATGALCEARVLSVLEPGGGPGLSRNPPFAEAFAALEPGADLFIWALAQGISRADRRFSALEQGVRAGALALTFEPSGVRLGAFGDLDAVVATALPIFLSPQARRSEEMLARLAPEAVLAGRISVSVAKAWRRLHKLPGASALKGIEAQARARGLEIETLLDLFSGHFVFGLWPAPEVDLSRMPAFDLRRTNPFVYGHTEIRMALRDAAKARALLPQVAQALGPALHAQIARGEIDGVEFFTLRYHLGEGMSFGILGDEVVVTGGAEVFAQAIARAKRGTPGFGVTQAKAPFMGLLRGQGSAAAVLQTGRLLTALGDVDAERLGGGPGGMAAALVVRKLRSTLLKIDHLTFLFTPRASAVEASLGVVFVASAAPGTDPQTPTSP